MEKREQGEDAKTLDHPGGITMAVLQSVATEFRIAGLGSGHVSFIHSGTEGYLNSLSPIFFTE